MLQGNFPGAVRGVGHVARRGPGCHGTGCKGQTGACACPSSYTGTPILGDTGVTKEMGTEPGLASKRTWLAMAPPQATCPCKGLGAQRSASEGQGQHSRGHVLIAGMGVYTRLMPQAAHPLVLAVPGGFSGVPGGEQELQGAPGTPSEMCVCARVCACMCVPIPLSSILVPLG